MLPNLAIFDAMSGLMIFAVFNISHTSLALAFNEKSGRTIFIDFGVLMFSILPDAFSFIDFVLCDILSELIARLFNSPFRLRLILKRSLEFFNFGTNGAKSLSEI